MYVRFSHVKVDIPESGSKPKGFFENRRTACSPISISIHININDYLINLVLLCTYFFSHVKVDFREQPVRQFSYGGRGGHKFVLAVN
jgi:hypothetical protein